MTPDVEELAADLVLGLAAQEEPEREADARARLAADPRGPETERALRATVDVLRAWARSFETLPPATLPERRRIRRRVVVSAVALLLVVLGVALWSALTPPDAEWINSWNWAQQMEPLELDTRAPFGPGTSPGEAATASAFLGKLGFSLRIPLELDSLGKLAGAQTSDGMHVHLAYLTVDGHRSDVWITPSPLSNRTGSTSDSYGYGALVAIRGGLAIRVTGPPKSASVEILEEFLPR